MQQNPGRAPMPPNVREQFHPVLPYCVGGFYRSDVFEDGQRRPGRMRLNDTWRFDETVGRRWPADELVEMMLQEAQLKRWNGDSSVLDAG